MSGYRLPAKKGPDYIDAGWLALAGGRPCHNLDPYLFSLPAVRHSFFTHAADVDIPVIGAIGKLSGRDFPERHMGLVPTPEHVWANASIDAARRVAEQCIDIDAVLHIAKTHPVPAPRHADHILTQTQVSTCHSHHPVIGIVRDSAFQFYYPENIEAIKNAGGEVIFVSPLSDRSFPEMDALYIGGGFPETHAKQLSENKTFLDGVKAAAEGGMPIYAECGGLMYLGEALELDRRYEMAGVFPVMFGFCAKPRGHGYTHAVVTGENPFSPVGSELWGHEFHYSTVINDHATWPNMVFSLTRGKGIFNKKDAMVVKNVLATYTHIHALGNPGWAPAMVEAARKYHEQKKAG